MSHECEVCGETFETLTRLRLHDCPGYDTTAVDRHIREARQGDPAAVRRAIDEYETALQSAVDTDSSGDQYREIFWDYYEPLANELDNVTRAEGWPFLAELIKNFNPGGKEDVPFASAAIENAVGRLLIRTRLTEDVKAIPADALEYLGGIPYRTEGDVAREESFSYGWGIGHPEHAVPDHVFDAIHDHMFWVKAVIEHGFYADQRAALDLLTELIHDDSIGFSVSHPSGEIEKPWFLLSSVSGLATDYWPQLPRYWDWRIGLDYTFEWEPEVDQQLRDLVTETGIADELSDDWTLQDLAL